MKNHTQYLYLHIVILQGKRRRKEKYYEQLVIASRDHTSYNHSSNIVMCCWRWIFLFAERWHEQAWLIGEQWFDWKCCFLILGYLNFLTNLNLSLFLFDFIRRYLTVCLFAVDSRSFYGHALLDLNHWSLSKY